MADKVVQGILVLFLVTIGAVSLFVNILALVVWWKKKHLRSPVYHYWMSLVVVDLLAVFTWTSLSVSAVVGDGWILPDALCNFHVYFITLCNTLNTHTLAVLALERLLKFFKPSKHEDICLGFFINLFLGGLWFFDAVVCVFSAIKWAEVKYYPAQYQCAPEYQLSTTHMNFMFIITYGIPMLIMFVCYSACFMKLHHMRKTIQPTGALVLETNTLAKGDSYSDRMKRYGEMFQNAGMKANKPTLGKTYDYTREGYVTSSDIDDPATQNSKPKFKRKQYSLAKEDYTLMKVYVVVSCAYVSIWIPYVVSSYVWTYSRRTPFPGGLITFFVWISHCGSFVKPLLYGLLVGKFRDAVGEVLKHRK